MSLVLSFFCAAPATAESSTLSLHDALPIWEVELILVVRLRRVAVALGRVRPWVVTGERSDGAAVRSEEHTSELQSRRDLVCRLLREKKNMGDANNGRTFYWRCTRRDTGLTN